MSSASKANTTAIGARPIMLTESGGTYPARPATTAPVLYLGADQPTSGGSTSGGAGSVNGLDVWMRTT